MANSPEHEIDDELFQEVYGKEYTGPTATRLAAQVASAPVTKRPQHSDSEEEGEPDPNAVPTDFTSREAKAWEAKAKATERNWKKRKEEEMICKICGESGHFTQGCPSTLGSNRKSAEFIERVPARDKHVRALFSEKVVTRIEKDIGCKLRMDERFIIVSGKDRLVLAKGVDAVRKVIQDEDRGARRKGSSDHQNARSRSPDDTHVSPHLRRSMSQRSHSSPRNPPQTQSRICSQEKVVEDHLRKDLQQLSRGSPQGRDHVEFTLSLHRELVKPCTETLETFFILYFCILYFNGNIITFPVDGSCFAARGKFKVYVCPLTRSSFHEAFGNDGARGRSRSPQRGGTFPGDGFKAYDSHKQTAGLHRAGTWDVDRHALDVHTNHKYDFHSFPQNFEELDMDYRREVMELARWRDKEEDAESHKHRESIQELRDSYTKKLAVLRVSHAKQWEEFLHADTQRRQQAHHHLPESTYSSYSRPGFPDYEGTATASHYSSSLPVDSRSRYPFSDSYSTARPQDLYGEFQHQRREDYRKTYNRY
ncbi:hypothetical protein EJ110_NYTH37053 [Nymphaea thermarum]|nr:hypothetical protein EJ110_NYTH37053 [Nymphaea thermarum]